MKKPAALSIFLSLLKVIWVLFRFCIKVLLVFFIIADFLYGNSRKISHPDDTLLERMFSPSQ